MSIASTKIDLAQTILSIKSETVLKHLKAVINSYNTDLWDELTEEQKNSVKRARLQIKNGEYKTHKEVMKKYKKWLSK